MTVLSGSSVSSTTVIRLALVPLTSLTASRGVSVILSWRDSLSRVGGMV